MKEDTRKTIFWTRYGHYEFVVVPIGLTNAPDKYMILMNGVLRDFLERFFIVFLDYILIYFKTKEEH
jgi:hypothetical protein